MTYLKTHKNNDIFTDKSQITYRSSLLDFYFFCLNSNLFKPLNRFEWFERLECTYYYICKYIY